MDPRDEPCAVDALQQAGFALRSPVSVLLLVAHRGAIAVRADIGVFEGRRWRLGLRVFFEVRTTSSTAFQPIVSEALLSVRSMYGLTTEGSWT